MKSDPIKSAQVGLQPWAGGSVALNYLHVTGSPSKERLWGCHSQALSAMKWSSSSPEESKLPQPFCLLCFYFWRSKVNTMRCTKQNNKPRA